MPSTDAGATDWLDQQQPFVESARTFCRLIESEKPDDGWAYANELIKSGLDLAVLGFELDGPDFEYDFANDSLDSTPTTRKQHEAVQAKLKRVLGPLMAEASQEDCVQFLDNDLAEVYEDLVETLRLYDVGSNADRANAHWIWHFQKWHWHEHLYRALYSLNLIRFSVQGQDREFNRHPRTRELAQYLEKQKSRRQADGPR